MCVPRSVPRWLQTCLQRLPPRIQQHLQTAQVRLSNGHHDGNRKDRKVRFKRCVFRKTRSACRERLSEKVQVTIPKGNIGYNQYTVSWNCNCRTYFCCFSSALATNRPRSPVPFFQISLKIISELKTTDHTFLDCRGHLFPTTLLEIAVYYSGTPLCGHPLNTDTRV